MRTTLRLANGFVQKGMIATLFFLFFAIFTHAQRVACVDMSKILENLGEYKAAQLELDEMSARWKQEIAQEYDKIKAIYNRYQSEQVLLSDDQRKSREDEIMTREKLFKRRQELIRPIQDKVYAVIETYATERGFDFIFDKASASGIIFSTPAFDKTEDIKRILGK
jgi:outer membrane protein